MLAIPLYKPPFRSLLLPAPNKGAYMKPASHLRRLWAIMKSLWVCHNPLLQPAKRWEGVIKPFKKKVLVDVSIYFFPPLIDVFRGVFLFYGNKIRFHSYNNKKKQT
jgi:hypothetical protein